MGARRRRLQRFDYIPAGSFLPPPPDVASCAPGAAPGSPAAAAAYERIMRQFKRPKPKKRRRP
jgi:hypothetical protein